MGQQRVSNIALIHIERAYANFILENDIERIIDIFGSSTGRDSYYPRRARSALGVDTVLTLDVCMFVCMYVCMLGL